MCIQTPSVTLYANNNKISYVSRDMNKETLSEKVKEKQKRLYTNRKEITVRDREGWWESSRGRE